MKIIQLILHLISSAIVLFFTAFISFFLFDAPHPTPWGFILLFSISGGILWLINKPRKEYPNSRILPASENRWTKIFRMIFMSVFAVSIIGLIVFFIVISRRIHSI